MDKDVDFIIKWLFDNIKNKRLIDTIELNNDQKEIFNKLRETCVITPKYINWHKNNLFPEATVDNLKKMGFSKFYEENRENYKKFQCRNH